MILKTLGKLIMLFFAMMGIIFACGLAILILALIVRFKVVFALAFLIVGVGYFMTWVSGIEIKTNPRFKYVGVEDDEQLTEKKEG